MPPIFANDIGGIGVALQADRSHRDTLSQAALSRLIQANQEAERKREWEINNQQQVQRAAETLHLNQQQLQQQRDAAVAAALRFKDEMAFKEKEFNEYSLPSLQQSKDERVKQAADKLAQERKRALGESLRYHVENRLPYDPAQFKDLDPEVRDPLIQYDASTRKQEAEAMLQSQKAALFANRVKQMEKDSAGIKQNPQENWWMRNVSRRLTPGGTINSGSSDTTELDKRRAALQQQFAAITDQKTGLVEVDPETGNFVPRKQLVRPWMVGANAPATNFNWNRGNSFAQAMPTQTATQANGGDTSEAQPLPTPTITGTSNVQAVIAEANRAIQLGADPAAVKARLIKLGIQTQ